MKKKAKKSSAKARPAKAAQKTVRTVSSGMGVRPLGDRVLIKLLPTEVVEERTASGIIIPVTVTEKESGERPEQGVVIALGSGRRKEGEVCAFEVVVGDKVMFSASYNAKKIKIKGEEHYFISEEDILAVI